MVSLFSNSMDHCYRDACALFELHATKQKSPAKILPRKRLAPCQESNEAKVVFFSKIQAGFKIDPPLLKIYPTFLASLKIDPFFNCIPVD